jgi:hypothetical protein
MDRQSPIIQLAAVHKTSKFWGDEYILFLDYGGCIRDVHTHTQTHKDKETETERQREIIAHIHIVCVCVCVCMYFPLEDPWLTHLMNA